MASQPSIVRSKPSNGVADARMATPNIADTALLGSMNTAYLEDLYADFRQDPAKAPPEWKAFFEGVEGPEDQGHTPHHSSVSELASMPAEQHKQVRDSIQALMMIRAYRIRGHLAANLDPLGIENNSSPHPELDPETYGFGPEKMDKPIYIDGVLGMKAATPRQMLEILKRTYCSTLGVQFMHISDPEEKSWVQKRIEGKHKTIRFTPRGRIAILKKLIEAEAFERFLHKRYPGTKRFGIDGGEAMIPALEQIVKRGGALGVEEISIGMPHRGRLNVLGSVMHKPYRVIFHEFLGGATHGSGEFGSGDVKYHLGASSDREFDGHLVHLSLAANPSHLEAVNPVVLGKARAKQSTGPGRNGQTIRENGRGRVMPLILHGDAAFAGQGVVSECFALSGLGGYRTGGAIQFIVNNQIGFTTSPSYSRSSPYPSDVALQVQAPIFHVNGDDPEAVVHAARIATEYRQAFGKDVVIDMFCYRRFGHNEGDEPMFTQPVMYKTIKKHPSTREIYAKRLIDEGVIDEADLTRMTEEMDAFLETEFEAASSYETEQADWLSGEWAGFGLPMDDERRGLTAVPRDTLKSLGKRLTRIPEDACPHRTLSRIYEARGKAIASGSNLDWATAEMLAFGSLLNDGFPVRLSGQDSGRGTFSQRHSHIVHQETEQRYTPLQQLESAEYEVIDSLLSEEAVLAYEYGYSLSAPNTLVLWEAQFGDFANGAQVVFDQFISAGERKWLRMSGLVCLLPHGYEGQGPEHSSARLERYLQLCAQDNIQVANCTTPANYFHILRRQIHRDFRKPLILMTPKSLLRHKTCVSSLDDLADGSSFHRLLWDDAETPGRHGRIRLTEDSKIRRILLCSGRVYYDLFEAREENGIDDVYILRMEQLFPFPVAPLLKELDRFPEAEIFWVQEEPKNMGAWSFVDSHLAKLLDRTGHKVKRAQYAGRVASASTASGTMALHKKELAAFIDAAFAK